MRQLYNFARSLFPIWLLSLGIWFGFLMLLVLVVRSMRRRFDSRSMIIITAVAAMALALASSMQLMEERVHILTYGALGYMCARDLQREKNGTLLFGALAFSMLVASADELFQAILPYRVGDFRDIYFDLVSAAFGIVIFFAMNAQRARSARSGSTDWGLLGARRDQQGKEFGN
jgi:hypothetical protein